LKNTRAYKLRIYPNFGKFEDVRYTYDRFLSYVNLWAGKLVFNPKGKFSTAGLGQLANQAQHKARGIANALLAASKATGNKFNVPVVKQVGCPAKIQDPKKAGFDYWATVESQFTKGRVAVPATDCSAEKVRGVMGAGAVFYPP
jgi:hypothetical protein